MATRMGNAVSVVLSAAKAGLETDRELLARFGAGDETAFAALVNRHGGMVLGVCRRVLPTVQDAEDAFQATFLVLARKAASVNWQASVANWLYGTARRIAAKANRTDRRRAKREARPAPPDAPSALDQMTGREAFAALDAELDRLPTIYREPLVLCHLEGLTRDEAARHLGVPPATLKSRLDRGRKKLADALDRRGVGLGAGLLAVAATSPAGASPPRLLESILVAVGGSPSDAVATLARGVAVGTWKSKAVLAVAVLLGVAVGTTLLTTNVGAQVKPTPKAEPPKVAASGDGKGEPKGITYQGTVLLPDGKPAVGAAMRSVKLGNGNKPVTEDLGTVGADGKFAVTLDRLPAGRPDYRTLVASKPGYGPDWVRLTEFTGETVTLKLVPDDVTVNGTVTDLEGKPVAKATVRVSSVATTPSGDLGKVWEAWPRMPHLALQLLNKEIWLPSLGGLPESVTADAGGKFEIKGVGRGRVLGLTFEGPGIETAGTRVVLDPKFDPKSVAMPSSATMPGGTFIPGPTLYGPTFTHAAKPSQPIVGTVTDAATGKPVAGVQVFASSADPHWGENHASVTTDADGKFTANGIAKSKGVRLSVFPGEKAPYFHYQTTVSGKPGLTVITAELKLTRGVLVKGRIVEKGTGKPVRGAGIRYTALADNKFYADLMKGKAGENGMAYNSDADGRFQFVALPGAGIVMAQGETRGRNAGTEFTQVRIAKGDRPRADLAQLDNLGECFSAADGHIVTMHSLSGYAIIEPKPTDDAVDVEIVFDRGKSASGKVLTPDGTAAAGITARKLTACYDQPQNLKDGTFTAIALDPAHPRTLLFTDEEKKLAASVELKGDEKDVVLKLEPWGKLSGRLLDTDGKPLAGASVSVHVKHTIKYMAFMSAIRDLKAVTDAAGKFTLDVPAGPPEYLVGFGRNNKYVDVGAKVGDPGHAVKPGGTTDLGDFKVKAE